MSAYVIISTQIHQKPTLWTFLVIQKNLSDTSGDKKKKKNRPYIGYSLYFFIYVYILLELNNCVEIFSKIVNYAGQSIMSTIFF